MNVSTPRYPILRPLGGGGTGFHFGNVTPDSTDQVKEKTRDEVKPPRRFVVLMHNDDYTTMEFVVETLVEVFRKNVHDAVQVMLDIHHEGVGECGRFTAEVAETKVDEVHVRAKEAGYPLRCTMEPE